MAWSEVTTTDLIAEAVAWGLPAALATSRVRELVHSAPTAILSAAHDTRAPQDLVAHLTSRAARLNS